LPANASHVDLLDLELDAYTMRDLGLMLGAGLVVYSDKVDLVAQALNGVEFYRNETCGKCVPCRIGTQKLVALGEAMLGHSVDKKAFDEQSSLVNRLARTMEQTSICGLGVVAPAPLTSLLKFFPEDAARDVFNNPISPPDTTTQAALPPAKQPASPPALPPVRPTPAPLAIAGAPPPVAQSRESETPPYDEEYLFARNVDNQLIRLDTPTAAQYDEIVHLMIDGRRTKIAKAVPMTDDMGDILRDSDGVTLPRASTVYDATAKLFESEPESDYPIPILCHQTHMQPVAVCRVCVVIIGQKKSSDGPIEIKWERKLLPSCQYPVKDKMLVLTLDWNDEKAARLEQWLREEQSESVSEDETRKTLDEIRKRVLAARESVQMITELLMADHIVDEQRRPFDHSEYNELWVLGQRLGAQGDRFPPRESRPQPNRNHKDESRSPMLAIDHDACILCNRCIRGCADIRRNFVIGRTGKGGETRIGFDLNVSMKDSTCVQCGECLISCPTGAIMAIRQVQARPPKARGR
jgi:NAD-dependent dihydropyrimidine dehydrogenase PreA subunit